MDVVGMRVAHLNRDQPPVAVESRTNPLEGSRPVNKISATHLRHDAVDLGSEAGGERSMKEFPVRG